MGVYIDILWMLNCRLNHPKPMEAHNCTLPTLRVISVFQYGLVRYGGNIRLQPYSIRALELMADKTKALKEVAYDTGFSTPAGITK